MTFPLRAAALSFFLLASGGLSPALSEPGVLDDLNRAALAAYAAGKQQQLARVSPIIVVGNDITFIRNGEQTTVPYIPPLYDALKSVSHISLGAIVLLQAAIDRPEAAASARPHLEAMREQGLRVEPRLEELGFTGPALLRNREIITATLGFIDQALAQGPVSEEALIAFARRLAPLLQANAALAAEAQIDALHSAVEGWRAEIAPDEWNRVRVFIQGPRMPRQGNLQFSYFAYALGAEAVDTRLIYAENIFDLPETLNLLGTIVTDRALAALTFGDEMYMDRDLLADPADAYLRQLFGRR